MRISIPTTRFIRLRSRLSVAVLCGASSLIPSYATAADKSWTNTLGTNRWDINGNWAGNAQPTAGDRALIAQGSGAFLRLTNGAIGFQANVGTIQITTNRNQDTGSAGYFALEASNNSAAVSTIAFAASGAGTGFVLNMGTFDTSGVHRISQTPSMSAPAQQILQDWRAEPLSRAAPKSSPFRSHRSSGSIITARSAARARLRSIPSLAGMRPPGTWVN